MAKKKKNYSTYGSDWNAKVVDRERKNGVSINGVRVSDYISAQDNFDARTPEQIAAAEARKLQEQQNEQQRQQEQLQKQQQDALKRTQQTKREAGESVLRDLLDKFTRTPSPDRQSPNTADAIRGMFGNLLGVQKPKQPTAQSPIETQAAAMANPVTADTKIPSSGDQRSQWEAIANKQTLTKDDKAAAKQAMKDLEQLYPDLSLQGPIAIRATETVPADVRTLYGTLKNRSDWRTGIGAGLMDSLGIDWLMDRLVAPGLEKADGAKPGDYSMQNAVATAERDYPEAATAGNVAGTLILASGAQQATKGLTQTATGAIKGLSSLPMWVQRAVSGAIQSGLTFGTIGAYQGVTGTQTRAEWDRQERAKADDYAQQGIAYKPIDYSVGKQALDVLKQAGINALGGVAGSAVSSAVGATGAYVLTKAGLQTPLMEAIRQTLSGTAFAGGRILSTYWLYPKDARPTTEQIYQDFMMSFLFSAVTSFADTAKVTRNSYTALQNGVNQMKTQYAETLSGAKTVAEKVTAYENILQLNKDLRSAISQNYYAGQQEGINDILKALDAIDEQIGINLAAADAAGATGNGGTTALPGTESGMTPNAAALPINPEPAAPAPASAEGGKAGQQSAIGAQLAEIGISGNTASEIQTAIERAAQRPDTATAMRNFQAAVTGAQLGMKSASADKAVADTKAKATLTEKWNAAKEAEQEAALALQNGDLAAHGVALKKAQSAIEAYQSAFELTKAENAARAVKLELDTAGTHDQVLKAYEPLRTLLEQNTNATPPSAMGATAANDTAVLANDTAVPANAANETAVLENNNAVSKSDGSASEIAQRFAPVANELTGIGDQAEYDRVLQQAGMNMQFLRTDPNDPSVYSTSSNNSVLAYVSDSSAAGSGVIVPSVNDPKISETDLWEQFYHVQGDKNLRVIVPAIAERDKNGFVYLVKKGVIADQALTSTRAADNVSTTGKTAQAASVKPDASTYNIMSRIVNPGGVPRYQQTAQGTNNAEFNIVNRIINGGNANGEQGKNTVLAGQTISGLQQGKADNGSGSAEADRIRSEATGRNIGSAGRGGSDRAVAGGRQISAGASWNESNLTDLTQAESDLNEELTRAGVAPLEEGDLVPYENLDQESAYWLKRVESLSGRKALIYTSKSGRTDIKLGFVNNGREHVRYQPGRIMAFHFAHEIAENNAKIRAAGEKALRTIGEDSFTNYLKIKGAADADAETQRGLRKEFICDAYGAVMFEIIAKNNVNDQLGISADDYAEFQKAYIDHLAAPAISEEQLDSEMRGNKRAGGSQYSSTEVSDPSTDPYAKEAMRLYNDHVTYEAYMEQQDADWRVGKQLYGMWNGLRKIRVMQRALDLFENNVTPTQYWEKNKTHWGKEGDQDNQVLNQLYGMYLRNDVPMGGRFGEKIDGQLETLLKNIGKARQYHALQLTGMAPSRVFENFAAYRKEDSLANIVANYRDGEQIRGAYHDYIITQNSSRAGYIDNARQAVFKAFKGGTVRESNLAQLLGEKIVDKENLKQALYDGKHMLVRAIDGWFVFESSGKLLAFCDGETTFFRDPKAYQNQKAANKASQEQKTLTQKARERLQMKFTQVDKSVIRVKRTGNNAVIYIPGIKNPVQIQNGKAPNAEIAIRTSEALASYYADAWERQSRTLVENGYAPAKHIPDYFPHLWAEESGLNAVIESFVGYEPPTQIAGLTGGFKPGKPWAAHLQERTGPLTEFDAIRGFNQYVQKAGDVIFMTPAIQRLRQLESYLRENAGSKFDASAHSALVEWLRKYTNGIANKKAELDRSAESLFGHEAFSFSNTVSKLISRSAVQGSLSSALSQTISYIAALPTLNPQSALKGTRQAISQAMLAMAQSDQYDKFEDKVPFLKARFGAYDPILEKGYQKADKTANNVLSWLFTAMDRFATEAVARAKFDELRSRGRTEEQAGLETSAYCVKLFADRSKGMAPILFNNSVLRPFFQFQLEVTNQMSHFRDIKRQSAAEAYDLLTNPAMESQRAKQGITEDMMNRLMGNAPLTKDAEKVQSKIMASGNAKKWIRMVMYMVFLSLWGEFTRATMGRDQTWNPYGLAKDFIQDVGSDGVPTAVVNLGANALEQLPYSSLATGGRVPIGTGVDKLATVADDIYKGVKEGDWQNLGKHALLAGAAFTPGGGQARKSITGKQAVDQKGYYTDKGELRYPVQQKDMLKSILFGPSAAAPEGYDWNDTLSSSKTDAYKSMIDQGIDPMAAYEMLQRTGSTNATKGLAILTTDSDGDGKPDFKGKDINIVASILGIKYDSTKDGSFESWTKKAADKYVADAQKNGVTAAEKKNIDAINLMLRRLAGLN